jgi:hypothetical protein
MHAQFTSGSTGADGALNLTPPFAGCQATPCSVPFTPTNWYIPPNTTLGTSQNVFNFTTINIPAGVTLTMQAPQVRNRAVVWLATGNVTIAGSIVLDGAAGISGPTYITRAPSEPGPGGFPGGVGATTFGTTVVLAQPGLGYGGGSAGTGCCTNGGNGAYSYYNSELTPLVGGSGGGGGAVYSIAGGGGGAGGGALRIVSSTSISVTGSISAQGGLGGRGSGAFDPVGGDGSGGVIHLIAPALSGSGSLYICVSGNSGGNNGVVQFNSVTNTIASGQINGCGTPPVYNVGLYNPPLPAGIPYVRVLKVDGVTAPIYPTASNTVPDVTITASAGVTVSISAQNIPLGTVVNLYLTSEGAPDSMASCAPLAGTVASSTAACTGVNFPSGVSVTEIKANW